MSSFAHPPFSSACVAFPSSHDSLAPKPLASCARCLSSAPCATDVLQPLTHRSGKEVAKKLIDLYFTLFKMVVQGQVGARSRPEHKKPEGQTGKKGHKASQR